MKRRLVIGLLCLSFLVMPAFAALAADGAAQLTLEEAIRRGLDASIAMQRAQLEAELLELEYRQAQVNARATVTPLQLEQAKQAYENALYGVSLQRVQTALSVEAAYYSVLKAERTVDLRADALDRAMQQVEVAAMRHSMGQITDVQLAEAEQRLMAAELAYRQSLNNQMLARMRLNQLIGATNEVFVLTDDVVFEREAVDLDNALATAEERRFEIVRAQQQVATAKQSVLLADNEYTPRVELERAEIQLSQAELALAQAYQQVRGEVLEAVMRLEEAGIRSELAASRLELAASNLTLAELRYHNGLNTLLDVLEAEAELAEAEVEAVTAAYDYNVARAQYLSSIGLGFERWPDLLGPSVEGVE